MEFAVPVPRVIDEDDMSSNDGYLEESPIDPFFRRQRDLFALTEEILSSLRLVGSLKLRVREYRVMIQGYEVKLEAWKKGLPNNLNFELHSFNTSGNIVILQAGFLLHLIK